MLSWLLPKEVQFFDYFINNAELAKDAAEILVSGTNLNAIKSYQEKSNLITLQCMEALRKTFITPIDRNDIFKLMVRLNDIVDDIHAAARCYIIYKISSPTDDFNLLTNVLLDCIKELLNAVKQLHDLKNSQQIQINCSKVNTLENNADNLLAHALGDLFEHEQDIRQLIKWKEIYEHLEAATDRCEDAAHIIEGIIFGAFMTFVLLTIIVAILFDVVNGFHDAANSIATVVSTRVLSPKYAVLWAAFFNFIAMFLFAPHVADTIAKIVKIQPDQVVYTYVVFAGVAGAIVWNLITWWLGLPTSSSHALIGGVSGAGVMHAGWEALQWDKLTTTIIFIVLAPLIGLILGFLFMLVVSWIFKNFRPNNVDGWFRRGQFVSAALYSIGHGANDAQKTMGIIVALLIAAGHFSPDTHLSLYDPSTAWIIFVCHLAMAIGTAFGGWRIVKTMGMKITKLKPVGGFCAETAGAFTLFFATSMGIPVSTTHTITGSIVGVGSCSTKFSSVRWGIARRIVWAWIFTIPTAGTIAALIFTMVSI